MFISSSRDLVAAEGICLERIADVLRAEVARAQAAYRAVPDEFQKLAADIPSGLPTPDGTDRLINAGKAYRFSMRVYSDALREYNNFILTGLVPQRREGEESKD